VRPIRHCCSIFTSVPTNKRLDSKSSSTRFVARVHICRESCRESKRLFPWDDMKHLRKVQNDQKYDSRKDDISNA